MGAMKRLVLPIAILLLGAGCVPAPPATSSGTAYDASGQGLPGISAEFFLSHTDLETLDLSDNRITGALPAEIGRLQRLRTLDVSGNAMTGVPAEIGRLRDLEVLDLSDNRLTGLPLELGDLTQLRVLDLSGNPVSEQDLAQIAARLTDTDIRR